MVRDTNNFLQAVKQLDAISQLGPEHSSDLKLDVLSEPLTSISVYLLPIMHKYCETVHKSCWSKAGV